MFGLKREVLDKMYNNGENIPITGLLTGTLVSRQEILASDRFPVFLTGTMNF